MNPVTAFEVPTEFEEPTPPDNERNYEFVAGEWVEKKMGAGSSLVSAVLIAMLHGVVRPHKLGWIFDAECGYRCFPTKPRQVRKPDVSFVRRDRLAANQLPDGFLELRPDLAVEVISPNDGAEEIEERVMDYLGAGVPLVWVIYPKNRCARVLRQGGTAAQLTSADTLSGEEVIPGFSCRLGELFPEA
jgi:Uma2 family endonuclease